MVRTFGSIKHTLPENPTWIEFPRSDGDASRWPTDTMSVVKSGEVNFYRHVPDDESGAINWRRVIAKALAMKLGMDENAEYVLKAWPAGYRFYDHNKGPKDSPRHDPYLIGSTSVGRFRSCPEFIPHAYWLMTDATLNRANCQCKYCSKTPQLVISQKQGLTTARSTPIPTAGSSASQSISAGGRVQRVPRAQRPKPEQYQPQRAAPQPRNYLAIAMRKAKQERDLLPETTAEVPVSADRENDVRAVSREPKRALLRWHRAGELVWAAIRPEPIHGLIQYWPALVMGHHTKTERIAPPSGQGGGSSLASESIISWDVRQRTEYQVKLLGVGNNDYRLDKLEVDQEVMRTHNVRDEDVLPYQVYGPPNYIWHNVRAAFLDISALDWASSAVYDPFIASASVAGYQANAEERASFSADAFRAAAPAFSVAVGVASHIALHWTPTDQFEQSLAVPRPPEYGGRGTVQKHEFHGMWWGPERIWTDDLVRLKVLRAEYEPHGSNTVLPPAGPGPRVLQAALEALGPNGDARGDTKWESEEQMLAQLGAGTRGLLMRIHAIYALDPPPGQMAELKLAGRLYELVDDDWEEGMVSVKTTLSMPQVDSQPGVATPAKSPSDSPSVAEVPPPVAPSTLGQPPMGAISSGAPLEPQPTQRASRPPWIVGKQLPPAPDGYKWRSILHENMEAEVPLALVAGRYYPRLHMHPGIQDALRAGSETPTSKVENQGEMVYPPHFQALYGLTNGLYSAISARVWDRSRRSVSENATREQRAEVQALWAGERAKAQMGRVSADIEMQHEYGLSDMLPVPPQPSITSAF